MFGWINSLFHAHGFSSVNGLTLLAFGSAGVALRELPQRLWETFVRQVTLSITVKDDDAAFAWVKQWLLEQRFPRRLRRVDLDTSVRANELAMMPAPGAHWFWHRGRPFRFYFERGEPRQSRSTRRTETLTFATAGRRRDVLESFVAEIREAHQRAELGASRLYVYDGYWNAVEAYSARSLEAVILPEGDKERLVADLSRFRAARARYRELGVPYHRGYLFYGPPGTGKTSVVSGLAASFAMSIYALNLVELDDTSLKSAMNEVPANSVVLFEDIDCMRLERRKLNEGDGEQVKPEAAAPMGTRSRVTLSGLLNVLDGFHAPENVVFAMTTNDVEALDPALLRPGRIDCKLYMGLAKLEQRVELYGRFFPDASRSAAIDFAEQHERCSMAEFQGMLLRLDEQRDAEELELAGMSANADAVSAARAGRSR